MIKKSPRRIAAEHPSLASVPKTPPPKDSVSWRLWEACQDLAQDALQTKYIQGIAKGTLPPCNYGQYVVQDAVYCHHAEDDYKTVEKRAQAEGYDVLASFAAARYRGYVPYTQEIMNSWRLADISAVKPSPAVQGYIDHEHFVAESLSPIYGVVAMIPCDQIWAWLGTELAKDARPGNLYDFWIEENNDWGGAYRLDNFIDGWFEAHPDVYDWDLALYAYRGSMLGEVNGFRSAMGQSPLPPIERPATNG